MKRVSLLHWLACCYLLALIGCGGSSDAPTEVASSTPVPKPATPAAPAESDGGGEDETYGGDDESYGDDEESYGGDEESYGGQDDSYGGDEDAMYEGEDEEDEAMGYEDQMRRAQQGGGRRSGAPEEINASSGLGGGGGTYNGAEGDMYDEDEMEDEGYGDELGMGSGLGMEGSQGGYGGPQGAGMGGSRGGPSHNTVVTFLRSHCMTCHNQTQAKGGVEFASLTADYAAAPDVWGSVVDQLEAGSMPPSSVPSRPDPGQQKQVIDFIKASLARAGVSPDQDFLSRANMAFSRGREAEAIKLAYAHGLTMPEEEAQSFFDNVKWYMAGRRPATTLRFGVAVDLKAPTTLTDLQPIGNSSQGGGDGMYGGGLGELERGNGGSNRNTETSRGFADMTGDYGAALVAGFQSRWTEGKFGTLFNQVVAAPPVAPRRNSGFSPYGDDYGEDEEGMGELGMGSGAGGGTGMAPPGLGAPPGVGGPGGGTGMAPPGLGAPPGVGSGGGGTGMAPPGLGAPPGASGSGGGAGMAPPGLGGPPGGALGGMGGGMGGSGNTGSSAPQVNAQAGQQLAAGLKFLGIGTSKEMLVQVKEQKLDGMFLFSVEAKKNNRTGTVINETKVRFVLPDGKVAGSGTLLKNYEVERAKQRGEDDPVAKAIERLFLKFDQEVALRDMPTLTSDVALNRVRSIMSDPAMDKMTKLFETRLYFSKGLLTESQLETAYQIILENNDGVALASGTPEDRKMVLKGVL